MLSKARGELPCPDRDISGGFAIEILKFERRDTDMMLVGLQPYTRITSEMKEPGRSRPNILASRPVTEHRRIAKLLAQLPNTTSRIAGQVPSGFPLPTRSMR